MSRLKKSLLWAALLALPLGAQAASLKLLNVSYDPTREFYKEFNIRFAEHWQQQTGNTVLIQQSHGGSGKQARSVIDGLRADVVTLALGGDVDAIAEKAKLLPADWQQRLPQNSSPYTSTIVLLVRKGNPKGIRDWGDLTKPGISVVTPNPKTSGGARWNYLAAYGWALKTYGDEGKARDYLKKVFANVAVLDAGARGSTTTFVQRGIGDVLISWENEAFLALQEFGKDKFEIIIPSLSILAEPPVTLVDKVVDKKGTRALAQAYLQYLYSDVGQDLAGKHHYRPTGSKAKLKYAGKFAPLKLTTIADFGGWTEVHRKHFAEGALFDQVAAR